jgi:hypothetical protein
MSAIATFPSCEKCQCQQAQVFGETIAFHVLPVQPDLVRIDHLPVVTFRVRLRFEQYLLVPVLERCRPRKARPHGQDEAVLALEAIGESRRIRPRPDENSWLPARTLKSCGNSSIFARLKTRPAAVTRESDAVVTVDPVSEPTRIVRILTTLNGLPKRPMRVCVKKPLAPVSTDATNECDEDDRPDERKADCGEQYVEAALGERRAARQPRP